MKILILISLSWLTFFQSFSQEKNNLNTDKSLKMRDIKNNADIVVPNTKPKLGDIHYGNRVGGIIGQEGQNEVLNFLKIDDQITQITVRLNEARNVVKGFKISVIKPDNSKHDFYFGNTEGGIVEPPFPVKQGKQLIGISGAAGWFVDNIRFHFSDNSQTPLYGGRGGDNDFKLFITKDRKGKFRGRLLGFWGSKTDKLESIGLVFFPIE
jgi:hypothetical protein